VIIALTASAMKEDLELAMAAGMDDFLSKPVRKEELAAKIVQWTQKSTLNPPELIDDPQLSNATVTSDRVEPPVDLAYLHQLSEGDTEFERTILQIFVENTQEQLQIVHTALADRDLTTLQYRIHEIKGASANVGAVAIEQLAARLEELVSGGKDLHQPTEIQSLLAEIEHLTHSIGLMNQAVSREYS
jgi:HPt (histidine-containing phosphotransfer) domain-containing protein